MSAPASALEPAVVSGWEPRMHTKVITMHTSDRMRILVNLSGLTMVPKVEGGKYKYVLVECYYRFEEDY